MTPKERVMRRMNGETVDKLPNLNIIMQFSAHYSGAKYGEYCSDYKKLVACDLKCSEDFGLDLLSVISDPMREAHGFGADVIIYDDDVPSCTNKLIQDYGDIKKLKVIDPGTDPRMLDRIQAVELFKKEAGDTYPVCGWVEGSVAEASDLRDINDMMVDLLIEPEFAHELLEICLQQGIAFAKAQIDAGADIVGVGDAASSLLGPDLYEKFGLPYQKKLLAAIQEYGAKTKLHICGNIQPILSLLPRENIDILDVDWMVSLQDAVDILGDTVCVGGNYDPVAILLQGTKEDVKNAVQSCALDNDRMASSAGCEVPKFTLHANMKAVADKLDEMGA